MANEKRLIDANAADVDEIRCYYGSNCRIEDVEDWLNDQPTVDAVEVVHGRWLPVEDSLFPGTKEKCSLCGIRKGTGYVYHYCPNCGAKMDGERKDNGYF